MVFSNKISIITISNIEYINYRDNSIYTIWDTYALLHLVGWFQPAEEKNSIFAKILKLKNLSTIGNKKNTVNQPINSTQPENIHQQSTQHSTSTTTNLHETNAPLPKRTKARFPPKARSPEAWRKTRPRGGCDPNRGGEGIPLLVGEGSIAALAFVAQLGDVWLVSSNENGGTCKIMGGKFDIDKWII